MRLVVIEGGRAPGEAVVPVPPRDAVRAEADRRLRQSGCEAARVRALLVGQRVPPDLRYLQLQIEFAADALAALADLPDDFRDDRYWPTLQPPAAAGLRR